MQAPDLDLARRLHDQVKVLYCTMCQSKVNLILNFQADTYDSTDFGTQC